MSNNVLDFSKCANCGSCYNACPVNAISVDGGDFFYKLCVDEEKCTECGLCKRVCPINNEEKKQNLIYAYACHSLDEKLVKTSSSGGFFGEMARLFLENGGVVFGAAFADDFKSVEIKGTDEVQLEELKRSKYVESNVGMSFRKVKKLLEDGKYVFYCASPCQIAGLKTYLKKDYDNLLTADFICGGFSSHKAYEEHICSIEKKLGSKIKDVNFRAKLYGWTVDYSISIKAENGRKYNRLAFADPYFYAYLKKQYTIRDYCRECAMGANHYADIIIADYWSCARTSRVENDETGLTLVITNSPKGEEAVKRISKNVAITELCLEKASDAVHGKNFTSEQNEQAKQFVEKCRQEGFVSASKQFNLVSNRTFNFKYSVRKLLKIFK